MTLATSSEFWTEGITQIRQTFRKIENLEQTLKVAPPRITHTDILVREVQCLSTQLDRVHTIVNLLALWVCTGFIFGGGALTALTALPYETIAAAVTLLVSGTGILWACITYALRNV